MRRILFLFFFSIFSIVFSQEKNLAQKLGYKKNAKLLIIHGDDIGMSNSVTTASFDGFVNSSINSGSVMVPCPWLLEVVDFSSKNPEFDLGLHLTLTAEWKNYKWDGVSSSNQISSLLNDKNHFYDNTMDVFFKANPEEVRKEIQAQIDLSRYVGLNPSHIDSHMGSLFVKKELFKVYLEVAHQNKLISFVPPGISDFFDQDFPKPYHVVLVDDFFMLYPISDKEFVEKNVGKKQAENILVTNHSLNEWIKKYSSKIRTLKPGLTVILVHLGYDDNELKAVTIDHPEYGAFWRQLDYDALKSEQIKNIIKKNNIKLVTWKEIQNVIYPKN
jgi:predicted glycoside hydrolase/deacetylase ChbG (UPF0249 family)